MQKKILFIILSFIIFQQSFGQDAIAKLKFGDAEEAYEKGDYNTALTKLDDAEKILGEKNIQKILYLRIMAQNKLLEANSGDINLEQIALLRNNCKFYLKENESNAKIVDKFRDVYKTLEEYKEYEPFDEMVKGAIEGNSKAMVKLGTIYWRSLENTKKAREWLTLAKQKEVAAIRLLGQIEQERDIVNNVKPDYKKSLEYLLEASKKNDPIAMYNVGLLYEYPNRSNKTIAMDTILANQYFEKSFTEGLKQAEADNDEMMNLMNILYSSNIVKKKDKALSLKWLLKAAEKNNLLARRSLADAYRFGRYDETPKSIEKAIYYYEIAVSKGDFLSMESLGSIYKSGSSIVGDSYSSGSLINQKKSLEWYQKAADKGLAFAMYKIAEAYSSGENDVSPDYKAVTYATKSANKGNSDAMYLMGNFYYQGWGVTKNYSTAKDWWVKAATNGNRLSCESLGNGYSNGLDGFTKDLNTALQWYLKGIELNDSECLYKAPNIYLELKQYDKAMQYYTMGADKGYRGSLFGLGDIYYKGLGVKKDYEKAFTYYSQSAEKEWQPAMQMLVKMYEDGDGVKKDKKLAAEWQAKYEAAKSKE